MHYIKATHDVLGLENRVKVNLSTVGVKSSKICAINSFYLTDGVDKWYLYRKPSKASTQMWVTLKKNNLGDVSVDDTLNPKSRVSSDEILCRITVNGVANDLDALQLFNQGSSAKPWGCYGDGNVRIEAINASNITSCAFLLKPDSYTDSIPKVHVTCFRGVRGQSADYSTPEDGNLVLTFPV